MTVFEGIFLAIDKWVADRMDAISDRLELRLAKPHLASRAVEDGKPIAVYRMSPTEAWEPVPSLWRTRTMLVFLWASPSLSVKLSRYIAKKFDFEREPIGKSMMDALRKREYAELMSQQHVRSTVTMKATQDSTDTINKLLLSAPRPPVSQAAKDEMQRESAAQMTDYVEKEFAKIRARIAARV